MKGVYFSSPIGNTMALNQWVGNQVSEPEAGYFPVMKIIDSKRKAHARRLRNMSQYPGATNGPKLHETLQYRKHVVWVSRLHTGRCHLSEYIYRSNINPECECATEMETVNIIY